MKTDLPLLARTLLAQDPEQDVSESARSIWQTVVDSLPRVGTALLVVLFGWALSRLVRRGLRRAFQRRRTPSFAQVVSKVIGWAVLAVTVMLAMAITFPSVRPVDLLAGLGFFSVAVGFAFQDILENTLAGILLLFRQPFRAGDQIEVVDRSGTVMEINIRETRLVTYDGETVVIPNRDVYKSVIVVLTDRPHRRARFEVGIAYANDVGRAAELIVDVLSEMEGVETEPPPVARVAELGGSTVKIDVAFWAGARRAESLDALDAAIRAVKTRLDAEGIELPSSSVVLEAAPSFKAAIHGDADVTPGGAVIRPDPASD